MMPSNKPSVTSCPSPRTSEMSNPVRKSFAGNPFSKPSVIANPRSVFPNTPANSPSDFTRRSSVACRESIGSLRDFVDDKENGKDHILKPAKVRSPAASSKGSKNFMSPTISASCKIAESPRKKVLVERNEPVPTSVPSAEAKSHARKVTFAEPLEERKLDSLFDGVPNFEETQSSCLTFEDLSGENVHDDANAPKNNTDLSFEAVHDMNMNVPLVLENDIDTEPSFQTLSQDPDCVNLDPTFRFSPTPPPASSIATVLAPLDADPLMPPYDPKTNYLSPRPQFLHYKPKPRMELCNESIISGSFSDTEATEDTQSEGSQKESEDVSSDEIVKEEESQISVPINLSRTFMPEETVEANRVPKRHFSMRLKAFGLILLLSVAILSISITNSPVINHAAFEDLYEAYESSEFSEFARANFDRFSQSAKENADGLARNFHIWFTKSLSSMSELISNVRGLRMHSLVQLQYCNLTVLPDLEFGQGKNIFVDTPKMQPPAQHIQESDAAEEIGTDYIEDISAEHYEVYEEQVQQDLGIITGVENASGAPEHVEALNYQPAPILESEQSFKAAEAGNSEAWKAQEDHADFNVEIQPGLISEDSEFKIDVHGAGNSDTKQAQENEATFNLGLNHGPGLDSEAADIQSEVYDDEAEGNSIPLDAAIRGDEQRSETIDIPPSMVLYLLLGGGAVLIAFSAFNWSMKSESRRKKVKSSVEQAVLGEELCANTMHPVRNGPTEMDVLEEPCPSEMSSFQKSSSYSKRVEKQLNEAHSIEKKYKNNYRRESLASTTSDYSMGSSSSYGSLTVYEKIPSKQGHGDEGTVTPVRRSSRIRNLATSPL